MGKEDWIAAAAGAGREGVGRGEQEGGLCTSVSSHRFTLNCAGIVLISRSGAGSQ